MPELPEVETTANGIKPWLLNKTLKKIKVHNPSLRWRVPENLSDNFKGEKITNVCRRGKYILIETQKNSELIIHLGMSGSLTVITKEKPLLKHDHVELIMQDDTIIRYNDPRRFGCVLDSEDFSKHPLISNLGPEPLSDDFTAKYLKYKSQNKSQAVKNFIMDGHIVVGVGNIYASEALFMAGINPKKAAGKISLQKYSTLVDAIKKVLLNAIAAGGTTLKDFVNADGKPGYFSQQLNVYGRKDKNCRHCNNPIQQIIQGQRSTFYCPKCQR